MATVLERASGKAQKSDCSQELTAFLAELGELSRRFGLAIGDGASLYVMEPEDYARAYLASDESGLSFA